MKKAILLLSFIALGALMLPSLRAQNPDPDASFCDERAAGIYADPESCTGYYICAPADGGPMRTFYHHCPASLVYDPVDQVCDHISNVEPPCGTKASN